MGDTFINFDTRIGRTSILTVQTIMKKFTLRKLSYLCYSCLNNILPELSNSTTLDHAYKVRFIGVINFLRDQNMGRANKLEGGRVLDHAVYL